MLALNHMAGLWAEVGFEFVIRLVPWQPCMCAMKLEILRWVLQVLAAVCEALL